MNRIRFSNFFFLTQWILEESPLSFFRPWSVYFLVKRFLIKSLTCNSPIVPKRRYKVIYLSALYISPCVLNQPKIIYFLLEQHSMNFPFIFVNFCVFPRKSTRSLWNIFWMVILDTMEKKRIIRETPPLRLALEVDNKGVFLYPNQNFGVFLYTILMDHFIKNLYLGRYIFLLLSW